MRLNILDDVNKKDIRETLLLEHVHQHDREFQNSNQDKKQFPLVKSLADFRKKSSNKLPSETNITESSPDKCTESKSQTRIEKTESKLKVLI